MFHTLLIANRGEIACRIIRACRRLGIRAVAVYSDADAGARHVHEADEAVRLGPAPAAQSYLNAGAILDAARRAGADAIHPGYGFLAENAPFARACADAGLTFIGPPADAIEAMGDKTNARRLAQQAGVPVIPGTTDPALTDAALQAEAERIGYPVMVKAAAGGGGKGMRLVHRPDDLPDALASARREAQGAFGSDALLLERALHRPRHIEIQIFGDHHGNLIHLGERECSIQRRHQKVMEESPAPGLPAGLRAAMGEAAVSVARSVGYANAGTVEFLLDEDGQFYFLEMNTRLQVEHPVTERVTGFDLVEWQIRIAEGEPLPVTQADVQWTGHAIEARLYAENPARDFLPATGSVLLWQEPAGEGVRVDGGIQTGDAIGIHYDPLLAKLIAHGPDRPTALRRLRRALETTVLLGLPNNLAFLRAVVQHPAFAAGELHTAFIEQHLAGWREPDGDLSLALVAATLDDWARRAGDDGYWRNNPNRPAVFRFAAPDAPEPVEVHLAPPRHAERTCRLTLSTAADAVHAATLDARDGHTLTLTVDGYRRRVWLARNGDTCWVQTPGGAVRLQSLPRLPRPAPPPDAGGSLRAPMPGSVIAVLVEVGQRVKKGDPLLKLEAMKMEHTIRTAADGVVEAIHYQPGEQVEADALLVTIR
ncbi:MAG: acetyl/propionyl/methylcrotonyl-CoA carboxylase subunit alpha [Caldilineae bacterium]|nr:MAG: acetyl/propionyl/methylcrotonyl-CoA carboxylase subunit alpha [Caldilineae bacterium]